jgi:tyrosyl-tRNA synthetase
VNFPAKAFYLFSKMEMCSSSSEARRQILGGGVRIDGKKIIDPNLEFDTPDDLIGKILQVGKKKFLRVSI